jgi:glutathione-regulated potassium-efflux system ancillary protein KefC
MFDPLIILAALACGIASRALGLPALIGYLAAGFFMHEVDLGGGELLHTLSDVGITLLLFTIGLKLEPGKLLQPQVWGTTLVNMAVLQLLFMAVLFAADALFPTIELNLDATLVIAFALTFSSTVFVIQVMQEQGEIASRHANLAIGILIIQDLAAVIFLAASTGKMPEPGAVLLLALIPLRPVILRLLSYCGHGELFTLAGLVLALGGAQLCESLGVKGDLGVLALGALLAGHQKAKELSRNLLQFKDLFLICFFLTIGMDGWPQHEIVLLSVLLGVLALLKPLLYFPLLTALHTPPRTALLSSAILANYSEFGLIVIAVAAKSGMVDAQWSSAISLAIAVSFILNSPFSKRSHELYRRWQNRLLRFESTRVRQTHPDTTDVRVIILGMGNIGTGAYEAIAPRYGRHVLGVDENDRKLARHHTQQRRVVSADASDPDFWHLVNLDNVELIMLALTNHEENMRVSRLLEDFGYRGQLSAVVRFAEEAEELEARGISTFNLYAQAGAGFAAHAAEQLQSVPPSIGK